MSTTVKGVVAAVAGTVITAALFHSYNAVAQVPHNTKAIEEHVEDYEESEADKEERIRRLEDITLQNSVEQKHLIESVDKLVDKLSEDN